jgi:mannose-6-phosphate isomerase-like protein (cupin superfamily)
MEVRSRTDADAFTTLDGSTIRVLLDSALGGAANQSVAEASLEAGCSTQQHYHARSEEIYVFLQGGGRMEVEGVSGDVGPGDAVLIPAGAWHRMEAGPEGARFLCCCAPPYADDDTFFE